MTPQFQPSKRVGLHSWRSYDRRIPLIKLEIRRGKESKSSEMSQTNFSRSWEMRPLLLRNLTPRHNEYGMLEVVKID